MNKLLGKSEINTVKWRAPLTISFFRKAQMWIRFPAPFMNDLHSPHLGWCGTSQMCFLLAFLRWMTYSSCEVYEPCRRERENSTWTRDWESKNRSKTIGRKCRWSHRQTKLSPDCYIDVDIGFKGEIPHQCFYQYLLSRTHNKWEFHPFFLK